MRNYVLALACLRQGCSTSDGRGFDDLADDERSRFAECHPSSLHSEELQRALENTIAALLIEIRLSDSALAERIGATLLEIARGNVNCVLAPAAEAP
jgi:hypothetical protein